MIPTEVRERLKFLEALKAQLLAKIKEVEESIALLDRQRRETARCRQTCARCLAILRKELTSITEQQQKLRIQIHPLGLVAWAIRRFRRLLQHAA